MTWLRGRTRRGANCRACVRDAACRAMRAERRLVCGAPRSLVKRFLLSYCRASSALLRDLLDEPTVLASCGFDLCHKYILNLYSYLYF